VLSALIGQLIFCSPALAFVELPFPGLEELTSSCAVIALIEIGQLPDSTGDGGEAPVFVKTVLKDATQTLKENTTTTMWLCTTEFDTPPGRFDSEIPPAVRTRMSFPVGCYLVFAHDTHNTDHKSRLEAFLSRRLAPAHALQPDRAAHRETHPAPSACARSHHQFRIGTSDDSAPPRIRTGLQNALSA